MVLMHYNLPSMLTRDEIKQSLDASFKNIPRSKELTEIDPLDKDWSVMLDFVFPVRCNV